MLSSIINWITTTTSKCIKFNRCISTIRSGRWVGSTLSSQTHKSHGELSRSKTIFMFLLEVRFFVKWTFALKCSNLLLVVDPHHYVPHYVLRIFPKKTEEDNKFYKFPLKGFSSILLQCCVLTQLTNMCIKCNRCNSTIFGGRWVEGSVLTDSQNRWRTFKKQNILYVPPWAMFSLEFSQGKTTFPLKWSNLLLIVDPRNYVLHLVWLNFPKWNWTRQ